MRIEVYLTDAELKSILLQEFGFDERVMEVNALDYNKYEQVLTLVIANRPPAPAAKPQSPQGENISFTPPSPTAPERKTGDYYPPINFAAPLGPSVRCACGAYGMYKEYGWVDSEGNLHKPEGCEGVEEPQPISNAAALSASRTGEHGTVDADDDIPF